MRICYEDSKYKAHIIAAARPYILIIYLRRSPTHRPLILVLYV
jgi:hypothetical protein